MTACLSSPVRQFALRSSDVRDVMAMIAEGIVPSKSNNVHNTHCKGNWKETNRTVSLCPMRAWPNSSEDIAGTERSLKWWYDHIPGSNVLISRVITNKRHGWSWNRNDIATVTTAQICPIWYRSLTWLGDDGSIWVASPGVRDKGNVGSRYKCTQTAFSRGVDSCQTARYIRAVNKNVSCYKEKKKYHTML